MIPVEVLNSLCCDTRVAEIIGYFYVKCNSLRRPDYFAGEAKLMAVC